MRLGQTSLVFFFSRIASSLLGFVAMVYFARELGASTLGVYFLVLAVVSWLTITGKAGVMSAVTKRVSEGDDKSRYVIAGIVMVSVIFLIVSVVFYLARDFVTSYLGQFPYQYVLLLFGAQLSYSYAGAVIRGDHLVHFQSILGVFQTVIRVGLQIILVVIGFGAIGLIIAEAVSILFAMGIGVLLLIVYFDRSLKLHSPQKNHFASLLEYAKYSWLGRLKGSTYNMMDKLVLGVFVSTGLVGIYSICWNISSVLALFGKSLSNSFFPEMSRLSNEGDMDTVGDHLEEVLAYSGLFVIPGFVGAVVLGSGILSIYGPEFQRGSFILIILVGSTVLHSYHKQLVNTMNAVDRPDLSFRVNVYFVVTNVALNIVLVYTFGWIGAAVATLLSVFVAGTIAYHLIGSIVQFSVPYWEVGRQVTAATIMGVAIVPTNRLLSTLDLLGWRVLPLLLTVGLGVVIYFGTLFLISSRFRTVVSNNIPSEMLAT